MDSRFRATFLAALAWFRSKKRPDYSKNDWESGKHKENSTRHGQQPADDMLHAEWMTLQALIREIHRSEEQHQHAERDLGTVQLRTAKGLNRITAIGAIFSFLGLLGIVGSIII